MKRKDAIKRLLKHSKTKRDLFYFFKLASPGSEYKIKKGDTLSELAQQWGVTVDEIKKENGMGKSDALIAGKVIKIPQSESSPKTYKVKPGDTLSELAQRWGVSVADIQKENGMKNSSFLVADKTIKIPRSSSGKGVVDKASDSYTEDEVVAATLIGEGGSLKPSLMIKIMTIILNRADNTGASAFEVVTNPKAFSYLNGKDIGEVVKGDMGRKHSLWDRALNIVKSKRTDPNLGGSTYYYCLPSACPAESRNYDEFPNWADPKINPCWEEIYRDSFHVYGTAGKPWDNCVKKK